ncbi:hypothetical protein IFM89_011805 [Coptis chinensis]|uniref:RanBD1 domain-containing protein n=1 Tax=Coptis chinensis TaxID=261450 RepID=A0A835H2A8_9MAGN|nr:hypothetical protein IFM89_011805 [Coptis chinensis]
MASSTSSHTAEHEKEEEVEETQQHVEDEDTGAEVAPIVQLEQVTVSTGEENEHVLLDLKAKLYRYDKQGKQWKERGVGNVKFLKHKDSGKVRLVMRQSKTLKICANHAIVPGMSVQEHGGSEKSCVWHAVDFSDEELKAELFCIRFGSVENCKTFMQKFEGITDVVEDENREGSAAAELLERQLNINDGKTEKAGEKVPVAADEEKPESEDGETRSPGEGVTVKEVEDHLRAEDGQTVNAGEERQPSSTS